MMESVCRHLVPFTNQSEKEWLSVINFVYETEFYKIRQPLFRAFYQLLLVSDGTGVYTVRDKKYPLSRGTVFFIFPGEPYHIEGDADFRYYYISFIGTRADWLLDNLRIVPASPVFQGQEMLLSFWSDTITRWDVNHFDILTEGVLLYTISIIGGEMKTSENKKKRLVSEIISYVESNFSDKTVTVGILAKKYSYSEKYLCSVFKEIMGVGFHSYLQNIRIRHACDLLRNGVSVSEAASLCGYGDQMYFSKSFKKVIGCSPSQYAGTTVKPFRE